MPRPKPRPRAAASRDDTSGVPGAFRRFGRDRGRIAVTAALAAAGLLAGILPGGFGAVLHADGPVERGPYDLLVTAKPTPEEQAAEAGTDIQDPFPGGLVPPGLVTEHRLSLDELDAIREVDGVEVAAPYALLYTPMQSPVQPEFITDVDTSTATPDPQAYSAEIRTFADDGTGERLVDETSARFSLDRADAPDRVYTAEELEPGWQCILLDEVLSADNPRSEPCRTEPYLRFSAELSSDEVTVAPTFMPLPRAEDVMSMSLTGIPNLGIWTAAVDPAAEAELLGDPAPFEPLAVFERARESGDLLDWATGQHTATADALVEFVRPSPGKDAASGRRLIERESRNLTPFIVLSDDEPHLRQQTTITPLGATPLNASAEPDYPAMVERTGEPLATVEFDFGEHLAPLARTKPLREAWPVDPPGSVSMDMPPPSFELTMLARRPLPAAPTATDDHRGATGLVALRLADRYASLLDDPAPEPGNPRASSVYVDFDRSSTGPTTVDLRIAIAAGEADPAELAIDGALAGGRTLVADAAGDPIEPIELLPSITGLGIGDGTPGLLTSFDALGSYLPRDPIHAVRVRVAGVDAYTPSGIRAVEETAARLEAAGFVVTPVAGSQPVERDIVVDGYAFGDSAGAAAAPASAGDANRIRSVGLAEADADGIGRLGTVRETWTALGPAATAEPAPGAASAVAVWLGVGAALLALAVFEVGAIRRRRDEALVLRTLGWPGGRIGWWFAAPAVITFAVVLVVSQAALTVGGAPWASTAAEVLAAGTALIAAAGIAATLVGSVSGPTRRIAAGIRHPRWARIVGGGVVVAAAASLVLLIVGEIRLAGAAFFAEAVMDARFLLPAGLALLAAGVGTALTARRERAEPSDV